MFSVEYFNSSMVINTINVRRINFENVEELHRLVTQILKDQANKIILDLKGIKFIDSASFATIDELITISNRHNTSFAFANIDPEVKELFELIPATVNYKIEEVVPMSEKHKETVLA